MQVQDDFDAAAVEAPLAEGAQAVFQVPDRGPLVAPVEEAVVEALDGDLDPQRGRIEASFGESGHALDHGAASSSWANCRS